MNMLVERDGKLFEIREEDLSTVNKPGVAVQFVENFLRYSFPEDKKKIAALSMQQKLQWYAAMDPQVLIVLSNTKEFIRFWNLTYLWRLRLIKIFYKLKNWEFFRHYPDISEIRKQRTKRDSVKTE